jgi:hypothetical protein
MTKNPIVLIVKLASILRILVQPNVQYVVVVNIQRLREEPVIAIRVAAPARTSVIPRLPPNTTKNPIVSCAVLVNIQLLAEPLIAIYVLLASTAIKHFQLIAKIVLLVNTVQPLDSKLN